MLFLTMLETHLTIKLEKILKEKILQYFPISGGCITSAGLLSLESGKNIFLKYLPQGHDLFRKEARGLKELSRFPSLRVPQVLHLPEGDEPFILLEYIRPKSSDERPRSSFFSELGRRLAILHRDSTSDHFGFFENNYIGKNPQYNTPILPYKKGKEHSEFFYHYRLIPQLKLAETQKLATAELIKGIIELELKMPAILDGSEGPPSLVHGDLWCGNYLVPHEGIPCLIDPATHYGHRESDLAMTRLFGGFPQDFYDSYEEEYPLAPHYLRREKIYQLYHLLNHLNLFGRSYYPSVMEIIKFYAALRSSTPNHEGHHGRF